MTAIVANQLRSGKEALLQTDLLSRRLLGAFYTPRSVADFMADWVVRRSGERLLEPSFGDGIFLQAAAASIARRSLEDVLLYGVEIDEEPLRRVLSEGLVPAGHAYHADFLNLPPISVHAVLGNPPFVRLRQLSPNQRHQALATASAGLDEPMDPAASLWLPFVLHSMRFLEPDGRLAFVLPYELTYVRYARSLWRTLGKNFGSIRVLRTHERPFPEILQDVVILLADQFGSHTQAVRFEAFERVNDLLEGRPTIQEDLALNDLIRGQKSFIGALLGRELRQLLCTHVLGSTTPARDLVRFNIGYVAGDRKFFHPSRKDIEEFQIPPTSLYPSVTSARAIRGAGLRTSTLGREHRNEVFLPDPDKLTLGERRYIEEGERSGVSGRYKCQIRNPWFVVPGVRVPDVVVSVFSERPTLLINDDKFFASNSLLCGYCLGPTARDIAMAWYSSLTLLQCEIEVHALGGGVMVLIPGEAGKIRLPTHMSMDEAHLSRLDRVLRKGNVTEAYKLGDQPILLEQLKFRASDVELIRHGVDVLTHWRTSARTSRR